MRIASFGDTHLGPSPRRERFRQDEDQLLALCDHLEAAHDAIVLMGDMYQADYGWRVRSDNDVVDAVRSRYPRLTDRWDSSVYHLLPGNHDDLSDRTQIWFRSEGMTVFYHHGQDFDPHCRGLSRRLTMWSVARVRQAGLRRTADAFEKHVLERGHEWLAGDAHLGQVDHATRMIETEGASVVVMGHTHKTMLRHVAHGIYANSGICSSDGLRYVSVDTQAGTVSLCRLSPRHHKIEEASLSLNPVESCAS